MIKFYIQTLCCLVYLSIYTHFDIRMAVDKRIAYMYEVHVATPLQRFKLKTHSLKTHTHTYAYKCTNTHIHTHTQAHTHNTNKQTHTCTQNDLHSLVLAGRPDFLITKNTIKYFSLAWYLCYTGKRL